MPRLTLASVAPLAVITTLSAGLTSFVVVTGTGQGGRDVLHVPMSWCAVQGSPAAANPNITPLGSVTADVTTDAVLWRRHERPTDNILLPQADITLRSAINNAWGTLNFPIIADPVWPGAGQQQGDVRGEDATVLGAGSEFATLIQNCDAAWAGLSRAGIGITAININLFHDGNDDYLITLPSGVLAGTPIGWAGCTQLVGNNTCLNTAANPYDGRIMVVDNQYLYPTVVDRTLPVTPLNPAGTIQYGAADPFDQLVGHEVGHALGLPHAATNTDLMGPTSTDNTGDGLVDNINLAAGEITTLRASSLNVPGVQVDPPNQIDPGDFTAMTLVDDDKETAQLPAWADLTSAKVFLNKKTNTVFINLRVRGVTPEGATARFFVALTDRGGAGLPFGTDQRLPAVPFAADSAHAVFMIDTSDRQARGVGWALKDGELVAGGDLLDFQLRRLRMYPHYATLAGQQPVARVADQVDIYDIVSIVAPADFLNVQLDRPFTMMAAAQAPDGEIDFIEGATGRDLEFTLEEAHLPKCFAAGAARPGRLGHIRVEGLLPSQNIHGLIGPREMYRGVTDAEGNAEFDIPIPFDAREGLHLVTVGVDGTAFTADCVIDVDSEARIPLPWPWWCLIIIIVLFIVILLLCLKLLRAKHA